MKDYKEICEEIDSKNIYKDLIKPLCDRAKELIILWGTDFENEVSYNLPDFIYNRLHTNYEIEFTPIEQIFEIAFHYCLSFYSEFDKLRDLIGADEFPPLDILIEDCLEYQKEISIKNKKYIADFVLDFSQKTTDGRYWFPKIKKLKYIVEVDGFDFHSSKKQMNYDYQRENDLKSIGYKVIRFTGSQIYNQPMQSVLQLFEIIKNDINEEVK